MGNKGWFKTAHRDGDRTIDQQLIGLEPLLAGVAGKTVLDVGCAEGLLDVKIAEAGATVVQGIEIVASHIDYARKHSTAPAVNYAVADAAHFEPGVEAYDIVLLLAVLHKLKDPMAAAFKFGKAARELVVLRMPPAGPVITDARSGSKPIDVGAALQAAGLQLTSESRGTFDEWIGYYTRPKAVAAVVVEAQSPAQTEKPPEALKEPEVPFERTVPLRGDETPPAAPATAPAPPPPPPADELLTGKVPPAEAEPKDGQPTPPTAAEPPAAGNVPPESVHPSGDPAKQLTPEKIEPLGLEGTVKRSVRRNRGQAGAPDKSEA